MIIACPQCQARYRITPPAGGKQTVRIKCPGCQHIFDVSLVSQVGEALSPTTSPGPAGEKTSRPLVLVVDDARFFREMICDLLAALPIDTETAGDGHEALQKVQALRPALILLDLNIPGLSGQELITAVRRLPEGKAIRLLAMSGVQRGEETAQSVVGLGADDFISKSFKPRDLQDRVRQLLGL